MSDLSQSSTSAQNNPREEVRPPFCRCGWEPKLFKSRSRDNPNRYFWRCRGARGKQCRYYFWIDEQPSSCCGFQIKQLVAILLKAEQNVLHLSDELTDAESRLQHYRDELTRFESLDAHYRRESIAEDKANRAMGVAFILGLLLLITWASMLFRSR